MTNDECRAEALRLVEESKALFAEYERTGDEMTYHKAAAERQFAIVYAVLAGPSDG